jgi:hypothetical protein
VKIDANRRRIDLDDFSFTENTRAAYPITYIPNADYGGRGGHPKNIIFLTADAYGIMPPIARLTPDQAQYHFMAGYTARVAGTERGVQEPSATFSTCFGAPFMPLHPTVYARLLAEKVQQHHVKIWLVNTGWTGGPYGEGHRMELAYTRRIVNAALNGELDGVDMYTDPVFGFAIPKVVPGVPSDILIPRETWQDRAAYDARARDLAGQFQKYMAQFEAHMSERQPPHHCALVLVGRNAMGRLNPVPPIAAGTRRLQSYQTRRALKGLTRFSNLMHRCLPAYQGVARFPDGVRMALDSTRPAERWLLYAGDYQPALTRFLKQHTPSGGVCLDIGANLGFYSLKFARWTGPHGRVMAFEANPELAERIRRQVALNQFAHVTVIENPVHRTVEPVKFLHLSRSGKSSIHAGCISPDVCPRTDCDDD